MLVDDDPGGCIATRQAASAPGDDVKSPLVARCHMTSCHVTRRDPKHPDGM